MMNEPDIFFELPLFDALWKLDSQIRDRFPGKHQHGLASLGIGFQTREELSNGGYFCTPKNSLAFAWTGGDGEHFSFLVSNNRVDAESPVVLTAPSNSLDQNRILAANFELFLRLGLRRGYFALAQFAYARNQALAAYGDPDWTPSESAHYSAGYVPDQREQKVLAFVGQTLNLTPFCYTPESFAELQDRYMPLLEENAS